MTKHRQSRVFAPALIQTRPAKPRGELERARAPAGAMVRCRACRRVVPAAKAVNLGGARDDGRSPWACRECIAAHAKAAAG